MKQRSSQDYANNLAVQLRKGYLAFCVLKICSSPHYTSEIIAALKDAELVVVEGTIYPLLARLLRDGLLVHEWRESAQGPPRKYYRRTEYGDEVIALLSDNITALSKALAKL